MAPSSMEGRSEQPWGSLKFTAFTEAQTVKVRGDGDLKFNREIERERENERGNERAIFFRTHQFIF